MNYTLNKHKALREAVVAEISALPELVGGAHNARLDAFGDDVSEYPVATVFTGNDSATYTDDEANLRRDYDVEIVVLSKGYDESRVTSAEDSVIDACDNACAAIEAALTKFRFTLGALVFRFKYLRSNVVVDDSDANFYTCARILSYTAQSIEKVTGANV